jgi:hypothetical protein
MLEGCHQGTENVITTLSLDTFTYHILILKMQTLSVGSLDFK